MRIGLITSDLSSENGWATYSLNLLRELQARGIAFEVVCARNSPAVEFGNHPLLPTVTPPERHTFIKSLRLIPRVSRLLRDCDILHCTIEPYAILAAAVAGGRPLFLTAHGSYVNLPRMRRFPVSRLYRRAFERARLICVSRHTAQVARQLMPGARAHVINNGVDVGRFLEPPALPVKKPGPTVMTAGGIKPRKGTLELVEAMAAVRERLPRASCLIMGDPQRGSAYTTAVERRIDALGLRENVKIMGFVEDELMRAWLAAADVFALPAMNDGLWFEGFGLVLVEAGASGAAVVGTDGCGVADAIEHGETGLVISQERVSEALPRALLRLLENPQEAARMGAAGRRRAQRRTWTSVADKVIELYGAALG
ncbi:MAG: glycosyltransferase family 4 protein [Chloroflexota bacterium]|nr:glycosyltransferase family 4 protein [Chloroflexota bacterium]MDE2947156.1 glycosyltransferase family 4 protein [Chloroflexota bacterium]